MAGSEEEEGAPRRRPPQTLKKGERKKEKYCLFHTTTSSASICRGPSGRPGVPRPPPTPHRSPGGAGSPPGSAQGEVGKGRCLFWGSRPPNPGVMSPKSTHGTSPRWGITPRSPSRGGGGGDKNLGSPPVSRDIASGARGKGQKLEITDLGWVTLDGSGGPLSPRVSQVGEVTSTPGVACDEEGTGGHAWARGRGTKG